MSRAQYFHSIDNVLGAYEKRFFGAGFRRVRQLLNNIFIHNLDGKGVIGGQASIHYPEDWSKKGKAIRLEPHLSSIDALVLSAQLCELYLGTLYSLGADDIKQLWLRRFTMKSGHSSYHLLDNFPVEATHLSTVKAEGSEADYLSAFQTRIGFISLYLEYEHPISGVVLPKCRSTRHSTSIESVLRTFDKRYYSVGYKKPVQKIHDVDVDIKNMAARARISILNVKEEAVTEGQCAAYWPCLTPIDCMISIAQLAQALLYKLDDIQRDSTNNLWMRDINMYCRRPISSMQGFQASTEIVKTKQIKNDGKTWRIARMRGDFNGIEVEYSVAHVLPGDNQRKAREQDDEMVLR